ncbi:MAG: type II toxin-antitoxin system RelE/ParE family toxin [Bacteroidia bacterium]
MYRVSIEKKVLKQLEKLPRQDYLKLKRAINLLAQNPRPQGCKKLEGRAGYRIRVGDYRVIYEIRDDILAVFILAAGHRKNIYN